jgi:hypothetical protein
MPLSVSQPKAAYLRDLDAGLDLAGPRQRCLFPSANVVEEMTETQGRFFRRTECQKAGRGCPRFRVVFPGRNSGLGVI